MGTCYNVYAEANIDGRWYSLCPYFKGNDCAFKADCLFEAKFIFLRFTLISRAATMAGASPTIFPKDSGKCFMKTWIRKWTACGTI